jgi:hypothetical protein
MECHVTGIAFRVGTAKPIEELFTAATDGPPVGFYLARGLRHYCAQSEPTSQMCSAVIAESLLKSGVEAGQLGAVIVDADNWHCSREDETQICESLRAAGLSRVAVVGLSLQTCSGCVTSLDLAARMLRTDEQLRPVLILICGRAVAGANRVDALRATISSDGFASCVVQAHRSGLQLLASRTYTNLEVVRTTAAGEKPVTSLLQSHADIAALTKSLYRAADTGAGEVEALFCTNGSLVYATVAAAAAGIPSEHVYKDAIGSFGHVFSCDNLISLGAYGASKGFNPGGKYLLLGWSPYVFSGAIVECTPSDVHGRGVIV